MLTTRAVLSLARGCCAAAMLTGCLAFPACRNPADERGSAQPPQSAPRSTDARALPLNPFPDDSGNWSRPAKDFASTRFSALDQITRATVSRLRVHSSLPTGSSRGHEAAPLVVDGTMYVVLPFPNDVLAFDLARPGSPRKWTYSPKPLPAAQGVACCDVVNRGAAYADGLIVFNTLDNRTIAIDAATGAERWATQLGDINKGETMTMAPLVAKGKVLVGNSGGELGVRGWLTALDLKSGAVAWRAYSTGPDSDVRIGARFKPFYAADRGADLGASTWPGEAWKTGGGTVWGWLSYDPTLDLVYYGTGNPGPWNAEQRPGDNKWTSGIFARDVDTGEAVWAYQWSPHDLWDYDGVNEQILLDLPRAGGVRRVLVRPERNGYIYVLDRASGEVLSADPFVHVTSTLGVDLASGRPRENLRKKPALGIVTREVCPAAPGAKDWQPASYSPRTGYLYVPANNLCMDHESLEANYIAGTPYVGANVRMYAGPGEHRGELIAWDVAGRRKAWSVREKYPVWSGTVVTAGDVVFYGTMDGWLKALDATNGTELWRFKTASGIVGQPVSYLGPDGKQYIAVLSGVGGWAGAVVSGALDTRDPTAALGFVGAMSDLPSDTTTGGMLYIFGLP
jgi:PQQ-dependent dehydrogenase (methanol/ethanol family)